ncbi:MAG TPA: hypothetical protein VJB70_03565 [Candidatus Paceibacterota bacterium]|uniref:Uncharacterized protein n=1 Tax=Candidatus Ryanbacteria bacterium RIFCSPHIGHO2_01_FULL_48_27 TaxID=1802115 RepID=A0A1G2FZA6_9BACT|nr:MAG: hypothetical protein A2756_05170 [Candidatus Ryanbacteria bacterium RIFCSPHIGHO2_01_FULL_48_27]
MSLLPFPPKINFAIITATIAVGLDITFHSLFTEPMESFDYFSVKWLLGFFVTTIFLNWSLNIGRLLKNIPAVLIAAGSFSFLMSLYYRWWEFVSGIPYGIRPPDIVFIDRSDVLLFAGSWFLGHSLFYLTGIFVARRFSGIESELI